MSNRRKLDLVKLARVMARQVAASRDLAAASQNAETAMAHLNEHLKVPAAANNDTEATE